VRAGTDYAWESLIELYLEKAGLIRRTEAGYFNAGTEWRHTTPDRVFKVCDLLAKPPPNASSEAPVDTLPEPIQFEATLHVQAALWRLIQRRLKGAGEAKAS